MMIKATFERSSRKGGWKGLRKEGQQGTHLEFYCRPKAQEKQHFGKSHFYLSSLFPRKYSDNNFGQLPPSTLQGVGLGLL